jgi:lysophospholipase L1-like esterase
VAAVIAVEPDIVVVAGGRNDLNGLTPDATLKSDIDAVFNALRAGLPNAEIIAESPVWDSTAPPARLALVAADVQAAVTAVRGTYVDVGEPLAGNAAAIGPDHLHPNVAATRCWPQRSRRSCRASVARMRRQRRRQLRSALAMTSVGLVVVLVIVIAYVLTRPSGVAGAGVAPGFPQGIAPIASSAPHRVALWIGDSYTAATGATSQDTGEACLTSTALGWECELDAEGGTGFIADGHANSDTYGPLITRLANDVTDGDRPQIIVVDAGRADGNVLTPQSQTAMTTYFDKLGADYKSVPIVIITPYLISSPPTAFQTVRAWMVAQAQQRHWFAIDPISEGWINSTSASMTIADKSHPNPAGHQYIATHLEADLIRLGVATAKS